MEQSALKKIHSVIYNVSFGTVLGISAIMIVSGIPRLVVKTNEWVVFFPYIAGIIAAIILSVWYYKTIKNRELFGYLTIIAAGLVIGYWMTGLLLILFKSIAPQSAAYFEEFKRGTEAGILYFFINIGWVPLGVGIFLFLKERLGWTAQKTAVALSMVLFTILIIALIPRVTDVLNDLQEDGVDVTEVLVQHIMSHSWLHIIFNIIIGGSLFTYARHRVKEIQKTDIQSQKLNEWKNN
ncbi:hypothetical protein ACFL0L_01335 [Patescibacteria group bacterium]